MTSRVGGTVKLANTRSTHAQGIAISSDLEHNISRMDLGVSVSNLTVPLLQFASQLLLEVLVQWWRRLALTTNASFCARVSCFTTYSRASAFPTDRNAS